MAPSSDVFAESLLTWFAEHGRHDLPWQIDRSPYRVWISEIMLQQTQVATVIPYFLRFVERFPDVRALAVAPLDDVLSHWSGLGYYARARNLHKAALAICERHGSELPRSLEALTALPGIGRSTAAAILALAWDQPHAILDGNVKRVLARVHAVRGWAGKADVLARLWSLAERHTPATRAADYTQAIMDLGATVCTRTKPRCDVCPVAGQCRARADGNAGELPTPRPKRVKPQRAVAVAVIHTAAGDLLLERRPPTGIWGGLLSLPELPGGCDAAAFDAATAAPTAGPAAASQDGPARWCRENFGLTVTSTEALAPIEHSFTHFDLTLTPVALRVGHSGVETPERAAGVLDADRWLWYNTARPLPGGMAAPIAKLIASRWPQGGTVAADADVGPQVMDGEEQAA